MSSPHEIHPQAKRSFFVTFSLVLMVLLGIALLLIFTARAIGGGGDDEDPEQQQEISRQLQARLAPVTHVITSDEELRLATAASAGTSSATASLNGEQVVAQVCGGCHNSGVMNAPKAHDPSQWQPRLAADGGIDGLVAQAIKGKGAMPPRGGSAQLTDQQIRQAIEFMIR
jgi:cytochrome c5